MNGKATIFIIALASVALSTAALAAQQRSKGNKQHQVVFDMAAGGEEAWQGVLNNVENVRKSLGESNTEIAVVLHGKALGLALRTNTSQQERIKSLADAGVVFAACENTMRRLNVKRAELLPFVTTVDSGVGEVIRKQEAGWAYIKAGS